MITRLIDPVLIAGLTASITTFSIEVGRAVFDIVGPPAISATASAPDVVQGGETVLVRWEVQKLTSCQGVNWYVWQGEGGFYFVEPYMPTALPTSKEWRTYYIPVTVPERAPVGSLSLEVRGFYQCPGQPKQPFTLGPVEFEVVE